MPKKPAISYFVLVHEGSQRQVTCIESTPSGFKQMEKMFKQLIFDTIARNPAKGITELGKEMNIERQFGQVYLVPEAGKLNSAPCVSPLQIKRWIKAATTKAMTSVDVTAVSSFPTPAPDSAGGNA